MKTVLVFNNYILIVVLTILTARIFVAWPTPTALAETLLADHHIATMIMAGVVLPAAALLPHALDLD